MNEHLPRGIIVSCQPASNNESFYDYEFIKRMALAAEYGGCVALRIEGKENVRKIIREVSLPVIALIKNNFPAEDLSKRCITPSIGDILSLYDVGAKIVAVDFTLRESKNATYYRGLMKTVKGKGDLKIVADISTINEAVMAYKCGVDYVSSTLVGYTPHTSHMHLPELNIIKQFNERLAIPYFAEGGFCLEKDIKKALGFNAHGVIIGTAITRPHILIKKYIEIFNNYKYEEHRTQ